MEETNNRRLIYSLDHLKPEVVAVAFAKCSRSPESFADIAAELTDEKSADFHEKWVVGYGHGSVAEHATLHMAVENVSILATKVIEDNRLGSYTEKSTRYQVYDRTKYLKPEKIMNSKFGKDYEDVMNFVFDTYQDLLEPMRNFITKKYPMKEGEMEKAYLATTKSRTCDNIRYMLPTCTLTNMGMTMNSRVLEHAIVKLLSHPLKEMQEIGAELKAEGMKITPTLIRFADTNKYLKETAGALEAQNRELLNESPDPTAPVTLVNYDHDAEDKLVASILYSVSTLPYSQIFKKVKEMSKEQKEKVIDEALCRRASFDQPIRELEHIYYTFDILMDYGAFRDIQRHRICTQSKQPVTVIHGYEIPEEIVEANLHQRYIEVMEKTTDLYYKLYPVFPNEAQYVVPLAFRKRTLFTWNLRELHHFISLRSGSKGHISYRRIAQQCWQRINEVQPLLAKYIRVDMSQGSASWASTMYNPEYSYKPKLN